MNLRLSANSRFLQHDSGAPFFYLGDTAWELFHRLSREETEHYLDDRAAKKFTVVQAVLLAELDGLTAPNANGDLPLLDLDPTRFNESYFVHADWVVRQANSLGLTMGLLPTWGDKWNTAQGAGPEIFTPENAAIFGEFLGRRYRESDVIWILGGDRAVENETHRAIIEAMAAGIKAGDGGRHLMTFHPSGRQTSSKWFHEAAWLDFNMLQSGHSGRDGANDAMVAHDYALSPIKPCFDGEPCYENHPVMGPGWKPIGDEHFGEHDVRQAAYRALFAGAHGHTYGCHEIWQFWQPNRAPVSQARTPWREALQLPGAAQMQHARALLESKPFFSRVPDDSLILENRAEGPNRLCATRDEEGIYALVYFPDSQAATIDAARLASSRVRASWFDPRDGSQHEIGEFAAQAQEFAPPKSDSGSDWILVLDAV